MAEHGSEPPVPVPTVAPEVPAAFAPTGSNGLVTASFLVDHKGNVQETAVVKSSHRELEESGDQGHQEVAVQTGHERRCGGGGAGDDPAKI